MKNKLKKLFERIENTHPWMYKRFDSLWQLVIDAVWKFFYVYGRQSSSLMPVSSMKVRGLRAKVRMVVSTKDNER